MFAGGVAVTANDRECGRAASGDDESGGADEGRADDSRCGDGSECREDRADAAHDTRRGAESEHAAAGATLAGVASRWGVGGVVVAHGTRAEVRFDSKVKSFVPNRRLPTAEP